MPNPVPNPSHPDRSSLGGFRAPKANRAGATGDETRVSPPTTLRQHRRPAPFGPPPAGRNRLSERPPWRRPTRRVRRGLTLIELTISILIIGLAAGLTVLSVQALSHADLRSSSVAIAGAIKQSYDRAIMEKRLQRIAFDLENDVWWVEFTEDPYALDVERLAADPEELDDDDDLDLDEDTPADVRAALEGGRAASFKPDPDFGEKTTLPGSIHFGRAWTGMREEPFVKGTVYLHFFRGGFTEPLQLEIFDGDPESDEESREWVTLLVRPLTGRVKMYPEQKEPPEDDGPMWEEED